MFTIKLFFVSYGRKYFLQKLNFTNFIKQNKTTGISNDNIIFLQHHVEFRKQDN